MWGPWSGPSCQRTNQEKHAGNCVFNSMICVKNATATATGSGTNGTDPQDTPRPALEFSRVASAIAAIAAGEFKAAKRRALDRVPPDRHRRLNSAVLAALVSRVNRTSGYCFPSLDTIAADAACSRRSVVTVVARLEGLGLVIKRHQHSKCGDLTSNRYTVPAMLLGWRPGVAESVDDAADDDGQLRFDFAPPAALSAGVLHYPTPKFAPEHNTTQPLKTLTQTTATPATSAQGAAVCDGLDDEVEDLEQAAPYRPVIVGQSIGLGTQRLLRERYGIRDMEGFEEWFFAWVRTRPSYAAPRDLDAVALSFAGRAIPRMSEARMARLLKPSRWLLSTVGAPIERRARAEGWHPALIDFVDREGRLPTKAEADALCGQEMRAALGLPSACAVTVHREPDGLVVDMRALAQARSLKAAEHWKKLRRH